MHGMHERGQVDFKMGLGRLGGVRARSRVSRRLLLGGVRCKIRLGRGVLFAWVRLAGQQLGHGMLMATLVLVALDAQVEVGTHGAVVAGFHLEEKERALI